MQSELSVERSETVALLVREELARRRLSRQWLADEAKVSLSTLEKALAGSRPFTLATVVRLEDALGTSLRGPRSAAEPATPGVAPDSMGAYVRPAVQWLEGTYLTLRPSFSAWVEPDASIDCISTAVRRPVARSRSYRCSWARALTGATRSCSVPGAASA